MFLQQLVSEQTIEVLKTKMDYLVIENFWFLDRLDKVWQGLLLYLHMSTVNISLPSSQANYIDQLVVKYGFANRSEFIRSIIRLVAYKPNLVEEAATFPFVIPKERSTKKIINSFIKSNRYSKEFLKDLKEGLGQSDYFQS